jgi:hypothetical protein
LSCWLKLGTRPKCGFVIVASHYRALIEREEKADKAMMAELIERARLQREQAASKASLPTSNSQSFPIATE